MYIWPLSPIPKPRTLAVLYYSVLEDKISHEVPKTKGALFTQISYQKGKLLPQSLRGSLRYVKAIKLSRQAIEKQQGTF